MVRIEEATADGHSPPTDNEKVYACSAGQGASCFGADIGAPKAAGDLPEQRGYALTA
ncbi:hypothetical protein BD309DRAFT_1019965 [Dichomitus squalens]|nr:hypothetical protein BD309DRAFT_1019965 [Dichomitus squalens]